MKNLTEHKETYLKQFQHRPYGRNLLRTKQEEALDAPQEECGIFGLYSEENLDTFSLSQFGLFALQHRGQEACGISVSNSGKIINIKDEGLVLDVYKEIKDPEDFMGNAVIGHTRYTTAGDKKKYNYQPFFAKNEYDQIILSIAHNGNLTNAMELKQELEAEGVVFRATSDSEVILRLIQKNLDLGLRGAIKVTMEKIKGAYSVVGMTRNKFFAFRDFNGIRPLVLGEMKESNTYVVASESCALDAVGATYVRDIKPGEIIYTGENEEGLKSYMVKNDCERNICSFEYIYFARPDSEMEQINVHEIREKSGEKIWEQAPVEADIVIGVPDSGVPAAIGFSKASGIPFRPVLIKNRYIGRSFIVPTQEMRERIVNLKLNPIISEIKGKRVVIIDDSIVRGTTSKRLVKILKDAGVKEIHFRSVSPPIIAPCYLGIDTPTKDDLISANMSLEELRNYLGVDTLEFLSLENLKAILGSDKHCFGCFTERYPVAKD
ncbi:amidophosphoribosyltransferase [Riemerella anatipestifer]|uniref:Amidophosphoribosyltransferase n=1 Tax=Riemerella anatipestifer (strain ATCC 11845 / DSM 15868 / JCM 9532 / NCTC 11014) TaxID=693978 RepID=E4TBB9_RIEAD|nr:amidophosphoribosyltransferase [Riemerella anatipestifer]ADQ81423.1 amidophosphoribosyltransferase [Riemerella anatipestifer ATCC 11845 = DSM 15868]ADZ13080.1 Glutamine phosphoribosylpyrophosphate amidotransferase [Riemerella anatipestifer RA-GD]AFD55437.1 amidophosphoribosyltransferase [Riemerella anatipestifer ATCC 11845 = DSM 15868]AGC40681.1 Glutamine phosphoribosylpyrophosphate amidotransferase [Riemerella anatipestifer RA-CH-2]AKP68701.1 amidophosphoribosyltransferase [Riemerella anat